ncbi:MAG: pyruvate, phosphate dikinase [Leptonema illini]|uniref:Phosphoenolpyruvate synthase n=1 Tax=Leptonema illini TaxID=183 RepID=A0A833LUH6_9LEPT|nr:MAG: pyruvate, phosphate dikinase [Leptonema illini]
MNINTLFRYWTYRLFAPGVVLRQTYEAFRELLVHDSRSHELMADLENLYYQGIKEDFCRIAARYAALADSVGGMVACLERMAPASHVTLREYYRKFDFYSRFLLAPPAVNFGPPFTLTLDDANASRPELAGAKAANLVAIAAGLHLPVPAGFVITVNSFNYLLEYNDLRGPINALLTQLDPASPGSLADISGRLTGLIETAEVPPAVGDAILAARTATFGARAGQVNMIVRSSAVAEDGESSFAGQYASIADVGVDDLHASYLAVLASKYRPESLAYRVHTGFSDEETPMAVLVMEMVEAAASGVVYTVHPDRPEDRRIWIHTVRGRGEGLVSGRLVPEVAAVDRETPAALPPDRDDSPGEPARAPILTHEQRRRLAVSAVEIENHFGSPRDIEWALPSEGTFVFLQSRPLATRADDPAGTREAEPAPEDDPGCHVLLQGGTTASPGQASGAVWRVDRDHPAEQVPAGSILVLRETPPSHVQVLSRVAGVLAELGSVAGHFATVCREFGVPLLCGLGEGLAVLRHGRTVTMLAGKRVVCDGNVLPASPVVPPYLSQARLPYFRRLRKLLDGITPLALVDPRAETFAPEGCRSFHDIIRFCHEQAVRIMFSLGDRLGKTGRNRRKLRSNLPFEIFIVDVGGGLQDDATEGELIDIGEVASAPFLALWAGLTHPSIHWDDRPHFDWKNFGETVLADGISTVDSPEYASYAVLGADYVNLIMRFGYHFTVVDALSGADGASNYCQFRFAGGGAEFAGRLRRLQLIATLLEQAGFSVETRGDLLDARLPACAAAEMQAPLVTAGRLLGATRLMDMMLQDGNDVQRHIDTFLADRQGPEQ